MSLSFLGKVATTAEMLAVSELSNILFDAEFYSSRPLWHTNLSFEDVLRPYLSQKTPLRSQSLQSKPWRKVCIVPGLLLLECKCGTFYCEINEKTPTLLDNFFSPKSMKAKFKERQ